MICFFHNALLIILEILSKKVLLLFFDVLKSKYVFENKII